VDFNTSLRLNHFLHYVRQHDSARALYTLYTFIRVAAAMRVVYCAAVHGSPDAAASPFIAQSEPVVVSANLRHPVSRQRLRQPSAHHSAGSDCLSSQVNFGALLRASLPRPPR
jgi:hypothetical protein